MVLILCLRSTKHHSLFTINHLRSNSTVLQDNQNLKLKVVLIILVLVSYDDSNPVLSYAVNSL